MNAISVIAPYKYLGMWVFDDEKVRLVQEPFVRGADQILDRVVQALATTWSHYVRALGATFRLRFAGRSQRR